MPLGLPIITLDITSRNLPQLLKNVEKNLRYFATDGVTDAVYAILERWYEETYRPDLEKTLITGQGMPRMKRSYIQWKRSHMGSQHNGRTIISMKPLQLTGEFMKETKRVKPIFKKTRGKEVRLYLRYRKPFYLAALTQGHRARGGGWVEARPVFKLLGTKSLNTRKLIGELANIIHVDFSKSHMHFRKSLVVSRTSLRG